MGAENWLLLGHTGRLGRALHRALESRCLVDGQGPRSAAGEHTPEAFAAYEQRVHKLTLDRRPEVVLNCLAYTDVDRAEAEPERARQVNAAFPGRLARWCEAVDARLVHVSTDYVFSGEARRPYREVDPPGPLSAYGAGKLKGEDLIRWALPGALIVRTAWLFGPGKPSFVDKVVQRVREGGPCKVVDGEVGSPTFTEDLARGVLRLLGLGAQGLVHLVNRGQASRLELAREAVALAGLDPESVEPQKAADLNLPAARPAYSVLDTGLYEKLSGEQMPFWQDALGRYLARAGERLP